MHLYNHAGWSGLRCPKCGCVRLDVYYIRHCGESNRRCRICANCGRRVLTMERPICVLEPPTMTAKEAKRFRKVELTKQGVVITP